MRSFISLRKWLEKRWLEALLILGLVAIIAWYASAAAPVVRSMIPTPQPRVGRFDGSAAYRHVSAQVAIGPRPTGSEGSRKTVEYIAANLTGNGWRVEYQDFVYRETAAKNVIAKAGTGPIVILGAHYDTRRQADNDPDASRRSDPVPGANDGASGVAVLLELARSLDKELLRNEIWLTFFDAEDNGRLDGWDFVAGSTYMASTLSVRPEMVIIVDMIGDADQQIYRERTSTPELVDRIWDIAAELGYEAYFLPQVKWAMVDDHTPFLQHGIPAADLIDFDYPYWHTTQDTADKVSASSLERVGRVLEALVTLPVKPSTTPTPTKGASQ